MHHVSFSALVVGIGPAGGWRQIISESGIFASRQLDVEKSLPFKRVFVTEKEVNGPFTESGFNFMAKMPIA